MGIWVGRNQQDGTVFPFTIYQIDLSSDDKFLINRFTITDPIVLKIFGSGEKGYRTVL